MNSSPIIEETDKSRVKEELYVIRTEKENKYQKETEIESYRQ